LQRNKIDKVKEDMKNILVAEDNDGNYVLMTYILKRDYNIVRAINGLEAVQKVKEGGIDLVLMDINMPVMDGIEATKAIKAEHPEIPVLALTANAYESDKENAFNAGCDDFIAKPVNCKETLDIVNKYLK